MSMIDAYRRELARINARLARMTTDMDGLYPVELTLLEAEREALQALLADLDALPDGEQRQ